MENYIKRGMTIYSFKQLVAEGKLTWGEAIGNAAHLGITGMELLGQLFFRDCPEPHEDDIKAWKDLMWKYGTKTVCHDFFVDKTMYKGRNVTLREAADIVRRHLKFSAAIDCPIMRIGGTFDPRLFAEVAPMCEDYGVKLGVEIHNGSSSWLLPDIQETIETIRQKNTPYLGIIPDMSMFQLHIQDAAYFVAGARRQGVNPELIEHMKAAYETDTMAEYVERCNRMLNETNDPAEQSFLIQCRRTEYHDPKTLLEHMPYIVHIHGKFWEMDENYEETSIDYPGVLPVLVEGGYNGYISAEYEGGPVDGDYFEPQRRYQKMLDKYLGTYPDANYPEWPDSRPAPRTGGGMMGRGQNMRAGSPFKNHYEEDGTCTGVEVIVSNPYYRGVPLALFEDAYVQIDDKLYGPENIRVAVDGEVFKFEEMCDITLHYWNKGYDATLIVDIPGGLEVGKEYTVAASVTIRAYYMCEGISAVAGGTAFVMPEGDKVVLEA